ncbi:5-oxoprolinase subunit PxpB [Marixanthomonas ophiurae]|uniref:5-oxoprolinase subunit PxpB n=1 Tax=Marixanthomonas ophiurae TaxID=387659 RepID=A0A3E1Q705_9FLAO|nr:5-oxoprolinase subunit PxpB [Marixanthomonas ophiurae]RFN57904.1 5-oxoprolinase subunit PxpB [Marixanthomonas ophiurae]
MKQPTIKPFGEQAILIEWKPSVDNKTLTAVLQVKQLVLQTYTKEVFETVPAYSSLAVFLKKEVQQDDFINQLSQKLKKIPKAESAISRVLHIPVCYDSKFALDIEDVAKTNNLTTSEVIELHTKPTYKVYFLGFLPGFPYLGGLDKRLQTPRKQTPREIIEAGSVAIGGSQTGVYTTSSPGGWNIIGKSPLNCFSIEKNPPALLKAGDFIKFIPISKDEYRKIEVEVDVDIYTIGEEAKNG